MHSLSGASALAVLSFTLNAFAQTPVQSCPYTPEWNPCKNNPDNDCATFLVPEDWSDDSRGERPLNLIRIRSSNPNAESIVVNPGGPGSSGIEFLLGGNAYLRELAGDDYHIVSFDPRGVGVNRPYGCQDPTNVDAPGDDYSMQTTVNQAYLYADATAKKCDSEWGDDGTIQPIGSVISTQQTARDVKAISEKLNSDKMIRYWGFSYGTLLGDTIAKLFPTQIKRMVLDGNINPNDYYFQFPVEEATDIDRGIFNFFGLCAMAPVLAVTDTSTNPVGCGWTTPDGAERTNATLQQKFDNWVGADPTNTVDRGRTTNAAGVKLDAEQSYNIRRLIWQVLKDPDLFIKTSQIFQYWYDNPVQIKSMSKDDVAAYQIPQPATKVRRQTATATPSGVADESGNYDPKQAEKDAKKVSSNELTGITCVDNQYRPANLNGDSYETFLTAYNEKSHYAGEMSVQIFFGCAPWITKAKFIFDDTDRFANIETANPILYVQTTYDPVTPEKSGRAASAAFTNSFYIQSNGAGHCSNSQTSSKLNAEINKYWTATGKPQAPTETYFIPDDPNPFNVKPADTTPVDSGAGENNGDQTQQKRDLAAMFPNTLKPRVKRQTASTTSSATLGSCDDDSTSSTSATSSTATTTGANNATITSTGSSSTTASSSTSGTASSTTSGSSTTGTGSSTNGTVSSTTGTGSSTTGMGSSTTGTGSSTTGTGSSTTGTGSSTTGTVSTGTSSTTGTGTTASTGTTSNTGISSTTTGTASTSSTWTWSSTTGTGTTFSTWSRSFTTSSWTGYTTSKPTNGYGGDSTWTDWTQSTTKRSTSTQATVSGWGPWGADDPAYEWQPWTSQADSVPATKTLCGNAANTKSSGCSVVVVAVPTKTIYVDWVTDVCETGITTKTVTVTATCKKGCVSKPTGVPQGFITTKVYCSACAVPSDVIVTIKNPNGPSGNAPGAGNNGKPSDWSDGPAGNPAKPTDGAGNTWSTWAAPTPGKPVDPASGTWSAWAAPASGKPLNPVNPANSANPASGTWSAWNTPTAATPVTGKPADAASGTWSAWAAPASGKPADPASGSWSAWNTPAAATGTPVAGTTGAGSSTWAAWNDPTATGPIAKYTGGAVANTVAHGGVLAVAVAGIFLL